MLQGTVQFWSDRGFGFLRSDDGASVFLHVRDLLSAPCHVPVGARVGSIGVDLLTGRAKARHAAILQSPDNTAIRGSVRWWDAQRGFGWIDGDDGIEVFAHISAFQDRSKAVALGSRVQFDIGVDRNGRLRAERVGH